MTAIDAHDDGRAAPRPLTILAMLAAGLILTLIFAFLRFPYDRISDRVAEQLAGAFDVQLDIGELAPSISPLGPALAMRNTRVVLQDGSVARIDELKLRPAWSFSWLTGTPAIHVDLDSPAGQASGTVTTGTHAGWDGDLERFDLELFPADELLEGLEVEGLLSAEVDLHRSGDEANTEGGPQPPLDGTLSFEIVEGTVVLPDLPVGLPFSNLNGDVEFGGENTATISKLELSGPMVLAQASGSLGVAARTGQEPLDLDVLIEVKDAGLRAMMRRGGVRLERDGTASLKFGGTLSRPQRR